jgi:hypothetical protein
VGDTLGVSIGRHRRPVCRRRLWLHPLARCPLRRGEGSAKPRACRIAGCRGEDGTTQAHLRNIGRSRHRLTLLAPLRLRGRCREHRTGRGVVRAWLAGARGSRSRPAGLPSRRGAHRTFSGTAVRGCRQWPGSRGGPCRKQTPERRRLRLACCERRERRLRARGVETTGAAGRMNRRRGSLLGARCCLRRRPETGPGLW